MQAKKVRVVFETGDLGGGVGSVTITSVLTLNPDGSVTGNGILLAADSELAFAATGEHFESVVTTMAKAVSV